MDKYTEKLLTGWEETYKKGQLTFWLLLSIREEKKYLDEIIEFVQVSTKGTISCEEQSVYRAFRKFYDAEIVDFEYREGNKGPDRKYYFLTPIGKELLEQFIQRNILIFYNSELEKLLQGSSSKNARNSKK